jgi:hypothetical protein
MQNLIYSFLILIISSCSSYKNANSPLKDDKTSNSIQDTLADLSVKPFIGSLCDTIKMDYRRCVVQKAFEGDQVSAENITKNMLYFMKIEGYYMSKFRGRLLFNHLFKLAGKVFDCGRDIDGEYDGSNNHYTYELFYHEMIRSIDGMAVEKFLEKRVPFNIDRQLKSEEDKCRETLYKEYYEVIKKAYAEGKIVLKDYGEE